MTNDSFGHWFSGFADGEACFHLKAQKRKGQPGFHFACAFSIGLRADDQDILRVIKEYFGCGGLRPLKALTSPEGIHSNPRVYYSIDTLRDNLRKVLPHFDKYHLRSKKAHDYYIYRQAVLLRHKVASGDRVITGKCGFKRWTSADEQAFFALKEQLEEGRKFKGPEDAPINVRAHVMPGE